jgi:flagellar motor switch protein FliN/FliY
MAAPRDVLAQLLSPAQAETLQSVGIAAWQAAAEALIAFLGSVPSIGEIEGRLVMPDEIAGDFSDPHLVLPVGLSTDRDELATGYAVLSTLVAAIFFDSTADDAAEQEQQTIVMASTLLNQIVQVLNAVLANGSPAGLAISAEDLTANSMPALLGQMDEPALALQATVQGSRLLPLTLVLPGSFLDILAAAALVAAPGAARPVARATKATPAASGAPAIDPSLGFSLTESELDEAELVDLPATSGNAAPTFAMAGAASESAGGREPRPISQGTAAHRARFSPLPETPPAPSPRGGMDLLAGLSMNVTVELGRTDLTVAEVLGLGPGSVIELDRLAGEPVDILVNDRLIARGEVVVVDENFGVRVVEVVRRGQDREDQD